MRIVKIEVLKGKFRWYWRTKGGNGEIVSTSQKYWSKGNAVRAAGDHADYYGCPYVVL
jgi:hypothetical protein